MQKVCPQCGKVFSTYKNNKYCSKQCFRLSKSKDFEHICLNCGKKFIAKKKDRKFCSVNCSNKYHEKCQDQENSKKRLRFAWQNMKNRCYNKKCAGYKDYGGRGIIVCEEWKSDFKAFFAWALENGYKNDLTLDRIDYNGQYEPKNCRWVDTKTQSTNTRRVKKLTFAGKTQTVTEWSKETGIPANIINQRLRNGWTVEKVLTTNKQANGFKDSSQEFSTLKEPENNKICQYCGKSYYSSRQDSKYCSRECLFSSRRKDKTRICPVCGKQFTAKKAKQKYCSLKCSAVSQQNVEDIFGNKKRLHSIWNNVKSRCYDENAFAYEEYGGRGITVCEEWKNSFRNFYIWANQNGYKNDLTLDRIDVEGNYCPENCRWVCMEQQNNNKRNNRTITFEGETLTIGQWAKRVGVSWDVINWRLQQGWDISQVIYGKGVENE